MISQKDNKTDDISYIIQIYVLNYLTVIMLVTFGATILTLYIFVIFTYVFVKMLMHLFNVISISHI
jgi:hypothetical protein